MLAHPYTSYLTAEEVGRRCPFGSRFGTPSGRPFLAGQVRGEALGLFLIGTLP